MARLQYFGIKYPFQNDDDKKYFVDLNETTRDKVRSEMLHVIFTPKGQKLRDPEFGTDLIKFVFEPNDNMSWSKIKTEISSAVSKYVPFCTINNIEILQGQDNPSEVLARIDYTVQEGNVQINDTVITKI